MQKVEKVRSILITGANKGIGYATIERLLGQKTQYEIILTARNRKRGLDALEKLQKDYSASTSELVFQELDVSSSQSIDRFVDWIKTEHNGNIDVIVNNAGVNTEANVKERLDTIQINLLGAIELTEKLMPYLSPDGKVIMISSENGQLSWQSKEIRKKLEDNTITRERFDEIVAELIETTKKLSHTGIGWSESTYDNTKVLLNAYTRWILVKMVTGDQQCYTVDPLWCRTEMGTSIAPYSVERGADTPVYLINLPFKNDKKFNGMFFRDCKLHPF